MEFTIVKGVWTGQKSKAGGGWDGSEEGRTEQDRAAAKARRGQGLFSRETHGRRDRSDCAPRLFRALGIAPQRVFRAGARHGERALPSQGQAAARSAAGSGGRLSR